MTQMKLRKELDEYMEKRTTKQPSKNFIKDYFKRREFSEKHKTIGEHQIQSLGELHQQDVVILEPEPNFFRMLHDKILDFFRGSKKKKGRD